MLQKRFVGKTYLKYFFSYLLIFTILIMGFFFIIRNQLTKRYFEQLSEQSQNQLEQMATQLNNDLVFLSQIDDSINTNIQLIMSRYKAGAWQDYETKRELLKYCSAAESINSICYVSSNFDNIFSTRLTLRYIDDKFYIVDDDEMFLFFDPKPYFNAMSGQLIFVSNEADKYLVYFPKQNAQSNAIFFYTLDTTDMQLQMRNLVSDSIYAIALIDSEKEIVVGANSEKLQPYMDSLPLNDGVYEIDSSTSVCVYTGIRNGFSMVSLISNESLFHQINAAFKSSYLLLLLLGGVGMLLIFVAMKITYIPLRELTQKIVTDSTPHRGYLEQLDGAFIKTSEQNQLLKDKLDNYRFSIKRSLLDAVIPTSNLETVADVPNLDVFFDTAFKKEIYAIRMKAVNDSLPYLKVRDYFQEVLPGNDTCIVLEVSENEATFLINYIGTELNKNEVLKELLVDMYDEWGYLSVLSNGTDLPMDIPSLCENVMRASSYWPDVSVVDCSEVTYEETTFAYPHKQLENLANLLTRNSFSVARTVIVELFQIIDHSIQMKNPLPEFFVCCILIDILTIIMNHMNQSNINFKSYEELYYETLFYCRSCPYSEKADVILANIQELLDIYEQEAGKIINGKLIKQLIDESYCEPDFSLYVLADKFQVSVAYTSNLVKKELNQNFAEYLWELRLKKAKELLKETDMPIDDISVSVGYINTSSFRRKFKQDIGMTPSQFRIESVE